MINLEPTYSKSICFSESAVSTDLKITKRKNDENDWLTSEEYEMGELLARLL